MWGCTAFTGHTASPPDAADPLLSWHLPAEAPEIIVPPAAPGAVAGGAGAQMGTPRRSSYTEAVRSGAGPHPWWMRALCIPTSVWDKVNLQRPVGTSLQVRGVTFLLQTQHGESHAASDTVEAAAAVAAASVPSMGLPPELQQLSQASHSRRRQAPAQQHVVLRQWGLEVDLRLLPPGWPDEQSQPGPPAGSPAGSVGLRTPQRSFVGLDSIRERQEGGDPEDTPPSSVRSRHGRGSIPNGLHASLSNRDLRGATPATPPFPSKQSNPLCESGSRCADLYMQREHGSVLENLQGLALLTDLWCVDLGPALCSCLC